MSYITYIAANKPIPEKPNPFIRTSSLGNIIFETEEHLCYPSVYPIKKKDRVDIINSDKIFFSEIEIPRAVVGKGQEVYFILQLIIDLLADVPEVELWRIWLGGEDPIKDMARVNLVLKNLSSTEIVDFFNYKSDVVCMKVSR